MMQNLRRLFDSTSLPFLTDEVIKTFGRTFESDSTGTQISSILSDVASRSSDGLPQRMQNLYGGKPRAIDEDIRDLLHSQHRFRGRGHDAIYYETKALFHSAIEAKGFKIRPRGSSSNDSNILYRTNGNRDWSAGQVIQIFTGSWTEHKERKSEVFLVVDELAELHPSEIHHDIYRRFPAFKARLCHNRVAGRRVITLDSFLCQFARKAHRSIDPKQDLVLVFPITKVRSIIFGATRFMECSHLYRKDSMLNPGTHR